MTRLQTVDIEVVNIRWALDRTRVLRFREPAYMHCWRHTRGRWPRETFLAWGGQQ